MTDNTTATTPATRHASGLAGAKREATAAQTTRRYRAGWRSLAFHLLVLLALVFSGRGYASCENTNKPGSVTFSPPNGKITLSNTGTAIGTVVWQSTQVIPANYPTLNCSGTTDNGIVSNYNLAMGGDNTLFPTNLSWLSYRILHPDTSSPLSAYPDNASVPAGKISFSVASALQLVVTGTIPQGQQGSTQQMTIPAGQLAQWNVDMPSGSKPVEIFNITNISFVIPTCTAAIDPMVVTLSAVRLSAFSGTGSTAGQTPFQVQLNCVAGANLSITLSTNNPSYTWFTPAPGVIANTSGGGRAQNVGVQILKKDGSTPVTFDEAIPVGATQNGTMSLPFYARYYQTWAFFNNNASVGDVSATATYTLTYQ